MHPIAALEIAGSNPGYVIADHNLGFLGGGTQLAERCPGREALGRQGNPRFTTHQRPLWLIGRLRVCSGAIQICVVLRHYRSGGFTVDPLWICSAKNDGLAGTRFGGRVFQVLVPESPGGCSGEPGSNNNWAFQFGEKTGVKNIGDD